MASEDTAVRCAQCLRLVDPVDACTWDKDGQPFKLCRSCCFYCNPPEPPKAKFTGPWAAFAALGGAT